MENGVLLLIMDKKNIIAEVLGFIYGDCDEEVLLTAIQDTDADNLNKYESKVGKAIVANEESYVKKHFIRSGKIGEYKTFFNEKQVGLIQQELDKYGVVLQELTSV